MKKVTRNDKRNDEKPEDIDDEKKPWCWVTEGDERSPTERDRRSLKDFDDFPLQSDGDAPNRDKTAMAIILTTDGLSRARVTSKTENVKRGTIRADEDIRAEVQPQDRENNSEEATGLTGLLYLVAALDGAGVAAAAGRA